MANTPSIRCRDVVVEEDLSILEGKSHTEDCSLLTDGALERTCTLVLFVLGTVLHWILLVVMVMVERNPPRWPFAGRILPEPTPSWLFVVTF